MYYFLAHWSLVPLLTEHAPSFGIQFFQMLVWPTPLLQSHLWWWAFSSQSNWKSLSQSLLCSQYLVLAQKMFVKWIDGIKSRKGRNHPSPPSRSQVINQASEANLERRPRTKTPQRWRGLHCPLCSWCFRRVFVNRVRARRDALCWWDPLFSPQDGSRTCKMHKNMLCGVHSHFH